MMFLVSYIYTFETINPIFVRIWISSGSFFFSKFRIGHRVEISLGFLYQAYCSLILKLSFTLDIFFSLLLLYRINFCMASFKALGKNVLIFYLIWSPSPSMSWSTIYFSLSPCEYLSSSIKFHSYSCLDIDTFFIS